MKQPKVIDSPFSTPVLPVSSEPRYRYFLKPPATVSLKAGDLLSELPESGRAHGFAAERVIELPTGDIFQGPVPRISLERLAEISPECFRWDGFQTFVRLPAGKLAAGYHLVQERELIPEERPPYTPPPEILVEEAPEASVEAPEVFELDSPTDPITEEPAIAEQDIAPEEEPQRLTPLRVPEPAPIAHQPLVSAPLPPPAAPTAPAPIAGPFRTPAMLPKAPAPIRPVPTQGQPPLPAPPPGSIPAAKRVFSVLPLFRRKLPNTEESAPVETPPPAPLPRRRIDLPPPRILSGPTPIPTAPITPPVEEEPWDSAEVPQEEIPTESFAEAAASPVIESPAEEAPYVPAEEPVAVVEEEAEPEYQEEEAFIPPPVAPARTMVMETETMSRVSSQIAGQDDLQALFMTEETLTVDRVVELCGGLPGINSCVLSHGAAVIASHNVPDTIDLISLSAHALEMLGAMRESSAKMGVGAIPAVTLHSEKGPITFFHREDLCLLILHKDRGFVPGVREKLQRVVDELSKARLPRPLPSKPRTLSAE